MYFSQLNEGNVFLFHYDKQTTDMNEMFEIQCLYCFCISTESISGN